MLDRLVLASEQRALRGSRDFEEFEAIDEEFFLAKSHVQYHVEQLEKRAKKAEQNLVQSKLDYEQLRAEKK